MRVNCRKLFSLKSMMLVSGALGVLQIGPHACHPGRIHQGTRRGSTNHEHYLILSAAHSALFPGSDFTPSFSGFQKQTAALTLQRLTLVTDGRRHTRGCREASSLSA
jgi:hypothetical protein